MRSWSARAFVEVTPMSILPFRSPKNFFSANIDTVGTPSPGSVKMDQLRRDIRFPQRGRAYRGLPRQSATRIRRRARICSPDVHPAGSSHALEECPNRPAMGSSDQARRLSAYRSPDRRPSPALHPARLQLDRSLSSHRGSARPAEGLFNHSRQGGIVCNENGASDFDRLQSKGYDDQVVLYAFELLEVNGMGLEGIVSKRRDFPYWSGRTKSWIKVKNPVSPAMLRVKDGSW